MLLQFIKYEVVVRMLQKKNAHVIIKFFFYLFIDAGQFLLVLLLNLQTRFPYKGKPALLNIDFDTK